MATCFGFFSHHGARSGDLDSALTVILLSGLIQLPGLVESGTRPILWGALLVVGFLLKGVAILPLVLVAAISLG